MAARAGHDAFTAGQLEQALQHYEQALDQGAPVGSISVSRAIVHWHQGQPERAGVLLRAASEALGPDPELDNLRASLAL
jgi:hypothetical protein